MDLTRLEAVLRPRPLAPLARAMIGAITLPPEAAGDWWRRWLADPEGAGGCEDLLPLLGERSAALTPPAPREVLRKLTAAVVLEEGRGTALHDIFIDQLGKLEAIGARPLVVDGHRRPYCRLRHTSSITLLFADRNALAGAATALGQTAPPGATQLYWRHASGLPIQIFAGAIPGLDAIGYADMMAAAQTGTAGPVTFRHVSPSDDLALAALGHVRSGQAARLADMAIAIAGAPVSTDRLLRLAEAPAIWFALTETLRILDEDFALGPARPLRARLPPSRSSRRLAAAGAALVGRRRLLTLRQSVLHRLTTAWWVLAMGWTKGPR